MKKRFRQTFKRILAAAFAVAMAATVLAGNNPVTVQAQELTWSHPGNGWHYLEGTDISVKIENKAVYVYGTGEIPDCDYWKLYERPWANTDAESVYIAETITSIGRYAFYDMPKLRRINMYSSTFVKDMTCFDKICYKPIYRIYDRPVNTEMIGTIPYTSFDSIKAIAQTNYNGACWIMDSPAKAQEFQNSTNPTVPNVYYATEKVKRLPNEVTDIAPENDVPWENIETYSNGNVATPICRLSAQTPDASLIVSAQKRYQGRACLEAYAAFIEDYTFGAAFNVSVNKNARVVTRSYDIIVENKVVQTENELKYVLTIPQELKLQGRSFRLLGIGDGVVNVYDDLDLDDGTITFATNTPSAAYALVYK